MTRKVAGRGLWGKGGDNHLSTRRRDIDLHSSLVLFFGDKFIMITNVPPLFKASSRPHRISKKVRKIRVHAGGVRSYVRTYEETFSA